MLENVYAYFRENIQKNEQQIAILKRKIHTIGTIRLLIVLMAIALFYFIPFPTWLERLVVLALFAIPFIGLMVYHNRLFAQRTDCEALLAYNQKELKALDYDFSAFDGAPEEQDAGHSYSLDLDLFGGHSLFQSMNRCVTTFGKKRLAVWMKQPLTQKDSIEERQDAVRELAAFPDQFQLFYLLGQRKSGKGSDIRNLEQLREGVNHFAENRIWKVLVWIVPFFWLFLIGGYLSGFVAEKWLGIYLAASFIIAYWRTKEIYRLHLSVDKMEHILETYAGLMRHIEERRFQAPLLSELQRHFFKENQKASDSLKVLSRHIGALNQRFSLAGMILNLLYLRDTRQAIALEQWRVKHKEDIMDWIMTLADFDALSSLGNYAFTHPDFTYPEIAESYFRMQSEQLGHPLLNRKQCVKNPIDIPRSPWFLIITGANMAGKSTYLRTIGVNYLLACMGLPVCAKRLAVYPAHLVTSLRTSDSLVGNESYFFAELKRLKMIITRLQAGEQLFIILDEILKGTNSIDKQKGSMTLMKQLIAYQACGIIATHDLILGSLEQEFPHQIKNYRFEADIRNDELSFSYKLQEGIAQNMNACFLMKKMGITMD